MYGHPELNQKMFTWELLRRLVALYSLPWLCFGDFHEVLNLNEKLGGRDKRVCLVNDFREAIRDCDLVDMGSIGYPFTWSNGRFGDHLIEEKLDRFLGNSSWRNYFQDKAAVNLVSWSSDHNPILMEVFEKGKEDKHAKRTLHRVQYEDMWSPYERCKEIVKHEWMEERCWSSSDSVEMFKRILKASLAKLTSWSMEEFGDRKRKLESLMNQLKKLKSGGSHIRGGEEVRRLEKSD